MVIHRDGAMGTTATKQQVNHDTARRPARRHVRRTATRRRTLRRPPRMVRPGRVGHRPGRSHVSPTQSLAAVQRVSGARGVQLVVRLAQTSSTAARRDCRPGQPASQTKGCSLTTPIRHLSPLPGQMAAQSRGIPPSALSRRSGGETHGLSGVDNETRRDLTHPRPGIGSGAAA